MSETVNPQSVRAAIEQRVEALAMQLLMNGEQKADSRQWSEALIALSEAADAHGQRDIASLAREVAGQVAGSAADPGTPEKTRQCLEGGIPR